jgi:hypothetical protein
MQPIMANMAALAVASLFYLWRSHHQGELQRRRVLCQRVAHLLWVLAQRIEGSESQTAAVRVDGTNNMT